LDIELQVRGNSLTVASLFQDHHAQPRAIAMNGPRVLLMSLSVRTSARGNTYLSGWLGKAQVVGFSGEPDKFGNPTWDIYLAEPEPRTSAGDRRDGGTRARQHDDRAASAAQSNTHEARRSDRQRDGPTEAAPDFNDPIPF
jgi:hypothetical protein